MPKPTDNESSRDEGKDEDKIEGKFLYIVMLGDALLTFNSTD